ncbi:COQ9 family protein [Dongia rigui]|uniref:COQ9 family protein n=1 Tax=Dongia rigui TaxID=940149 RepID=A0ABU5DU22_9PROT|nr:COQ9 family protein [Dongia rigui]MDY0870807.1 COQ9 family protein [Dongia rigui]
MSEKGPDTAYDWQGDRDRLVDAILPHVPFDGWSDAAFKAGAEDAKIDLPRALNAFPGGMSEVLAYNHRRHDQALIERLQRESGSGRIRDRIAQAVRLRLELVGGQREAVRAGLSFLLLPGNATLGPKLLYGTVDAIWHAIGDKSTDFSFYTKRAILAGVYSATLLYWLNDKSENHAASWAFLDRRIDEVMKIPAVKGRLKSVFDRLPNPLHLLQQGAGQPGSREGLPLGMRPRRRRRA